MRVFFDMVPPERIVAQRVQGVVVAQNSATTQPQQNELAPEIKNYPPQHPAPQTPIYTQASPHVRHAQHTVGRQTARDQQVIARQPLQPQSYAQTAQPVMQSGYAAAAYPIAAPVQSPYQQEHFFQPPPPPYYPQVQPENNRQGKPKRSIFHTLGLLVTSVIVLYCLYRGSEILYQYYTPPTMNDFLSNPSLVSVEVGKRAVVPMEIPQVIAVTEEDKIRKQSVFFKNVRNGDIIATFAQAKIIVLYRPSEQKVVNMSSLSAQ
jgi:hypothetical protein